MYPVDTNYIKLIKSIFNYTFYDENRECIGIFDMFLLIQLNWQSKIIGFDRSCNNYTRWLHFAIQLKLYVGNAIRKFQFNQFEMNVFTAKLWFFFVCVTKWNVLLTEIGISLYTFHVFIQRFRKVSSFITFKCENLIFLWYCHLTNWILFHHTHINTMQLDWSEKFFGKQHISLCLAL